MGELLTSFWLIVGSDFEDIGLLVKIDHLLVL